jgi:hypothetical protein
MGFSRKLYLRLCFAGVVEVSGDVGKAFIIFSLLMILFSISSSVFVHDYWRVMWTLCGNGRDGGDGTGKKKYGIWLCYTCATTYDFHEHKHFRFGGSNDLGLSISPLYV